MTDETVPAVRAFRSVRTERAVQFGDRQIFVTPAVDKEEGGPLSAYVAFLGRGERADLPAPYEEVWVLTRGRLRIRGGETDVVVGPGDFLHVPEGSPGEVEAIEDTSLVAISVPAH